MTTLYKRMRSWFCRAIVLTIAVMGLLSATASAQTQVFFSPFKDVTVSANWNTGEQQSALTGTTEAVTSTMPTDDSTLTWAFATGDCGSESWGGITPAMEATNAQDFLNAGKYYIVSTGGADGTFDCPSDSGMETFIQTYYTSNMLGVDYDIEGGQTQAIIDDLINSTKYAEGQYPDMRFSFTVASLGASTTGSDLNSLGDLVMSEISRLGLGGNYYIDLMAFDYGSVSSNNCVVSGSNCDMAQSAIAAAESLHSNFGTPYSHIELCLMIGQADSGATETLSLANVETIAAWANSVGLGGIHYWSFDRDEPSSSSSSTGDGTSNPALAYNNAFTSDLGSGTGPGGVGGSSSHPSFSLSDSPGNLSIAQGASGSSTITVSSSDGFDSSVSLSVSGLPSGVTASLSSSSVTPPSDGSATSTLTLTASSSATTGSATVTITGTNGSLTSTTNVSLTVTSSGSGTEGPYGGTPAAIPGTVMAENYDTGGQGVGYDVSSVNGTDNGYRSDGVDLETATSPATGNDLGWTASGQWFRYTVNVATAGTYTVSFLVAAPSAVTDGFHISNSSGTNLSGSVNVPETGGWQTWATATATVTLPAGVQTLTVDQDNAGWNIDSLVFALKSSGEGPYGGTPAAIPGTVMAENYDTGGQGVGYSVSSVNGSDNGYRSDGVDLETATSPATGNDLGWTASGQWFRYTVNVATAGTYTVSFLVAAPSAVTDGFHISNSSGTNLSGSVNVPSTGGWQTWTTVTATLTLPAGTQTLTLNQDAAGWNIDSMAFALKSGGGSGSATLSPSSYNFGSTAPGTGTSWVTFTLTNSGSSAVSISNVTVSGPFVVSSNCGSSVAANGSCPIYVYFAPTAAGSFTGTLTVTDSASGSPQTSALSGTGS
jgi:hypothetical protein